MTVFHRVADASQPEYSVDRGEVDGLPVIRVNNTFRECDRFDLNDISSTVRGREDDVLDAIDHAARNVDLIAIRTKQSNIKVA